MNEELKDEEIILDGQVKESLTYDVNLFSIEICDGKGNDCELVKGTAFECFKEVNAHIKYHFGEGYAVYDDKGFFARWYPVCQAKKENEWAVMEDNGGTNN